MEQVAAIATNQHGLITTAQLHQIGVSRTMISRWVRVQRLHRLHEGVYAVGHLALTPTARRFAAVLAVGQGAALARRSAAVHLGLIHERQEGPAIEVTAVAITRRRHPGIRIIRPPSLTGDDLALVEGVPCTTVARTLVDLAGVPRRPWLTDRAVREAEYRDILDRDALAGIIARISRPRGVRQLRAALQVDHRSLADAGSNLERQALRLILDAGLPRPTPARVPHPRR